MRKGLGLATVGVVLLLLAASMLGATTSASTSAKASASCGTVQTKQMGALHVIADRVSCATARKVIRDFGFKGVFWHFVGRNHGEGYSPVDGWRCTLFQGHAGCSRGRAVIKGEPPPLQTSCNRQVEYSPGLFAGIAEYVGMTCTEARNFVIALANPPHRVSPGFVCHDLHVEAGGGAEECVSGSRRIKIGFE
jgi:hypothetical protein